ncbi:hypothetical protein I5E15_09510 [Providencia stuartii]|uniref:hypothetical protein n=1 Tax=Providencia stuartii TaxID=588 RepID=UPI0018C782F7|nr:hypothetical protein [Providencia stuartii]MBG5896797.1 hypothetical protein [Providencia stuartii]
MARRHVHMKKLWGCIKQHKVEITAALSVIAMLVWFDFDDDAIFQLYEMIFGRPDNTF